MVRNKNHSQTKKRNGKPKKGGYKAWIRTRHRIRKGLVR